MGVMFLMVMVFYTLLVNQFGGVVVAEGLTESANIALAPSTSVDYHHRVMEITSTAKLKSVVRKKSMQLPSDGKEKDLNDFSEFSDFSDYSDLTDFTDFTDFTSVFHGIDDIVRSTVPAASIPLKSKTDFYNKISSAYHDKQMTKIFELRLPKESSFNKLQHMKSSKSLGKLKMNGVSVTPIKYTSQTKPYEFRKGYNKVTRRKKKVGVFEEKLIKQIKIVLKDMLNKAKNGRLNNSKTVLAKVEINLIRTIKKLVSEKNQKERAAGGITLSTERQKESLDPTTSISLRLLKSILPQYFKSRPPLKAILGSTSKKAFSSTSSKTSNQQKLTAISHDISNKRSPNLNVGRPTSIQGGVGTKYSTSRQDPTAHKGVIKSSTVFKHLYISLSETKKFVTSSERKNEKENKLDLLTASKKESMTTIHRSTDILKSKSIPTGPTLLRKGAIYIPSSSYTNSISTIPVDYKTFASSPITIVTSNIIEFSRRGDLVTNFNKSTVYIKPPFTSSVKSFHTITFDMKRLHSSASSSSYTKFVLTSSIDTTKSTTLLKLLPIIDTSAAKTSQIGTFVTKMSKIDKTVLKEEHTITSKVDKREPKIRVKASSVKNDISKRIFVRLKSKYIHFNTSIDEKVITKTSNKILQSLKRLRNKTVTQTIIQTTAAAIVGVTESLVKQPATPKRFIDDFKGLNFVQQTIYDDVVPSSLVQNMTSSNQTFEDRFPPQYSNVASSIVGLVFIPGILFMFLCCRYFSDIFVKCEEVFSDFF